MNPIGGLVAVFGILLIVIGVRGKQHEVLDAIRGARPSQLPNPATPGTQGQSGFGPGGEAGGGSGGGGGGWSW